MKRDYDVGYKRPPDGSKFRKGRSGNPSGKAKAKPGSGRSRGLMPLDRIQLETASAMVGVKLGGEQVLVPLAQVVSRKRWQAAAEGHRLAGKEVWGELREIEAADVAQREASYKYWSEYCERWRDAPLNQVAPSEPPLLPHPRDIYIAPVDMAVRFVGPMAVDEMPMFRVPVDLRDYMLIAAELRLRSQKEEAAWAQELRHHAVLVHQLVAPSLGGHREGEPRMVSRQQLAARIMTLRSCKTQQLRIEAEAIRCRLEQTKDLFREDPADQFEDRLALLAKAICARRPRRRRPAI